jgi:hypothetical protein
MYELAIWLTKSWLTVGEIKDKVATYVASKHWEIGSDGDNGEDSARGQSRKQKEGKMRG